MMKLILCIQGLHRRKYIFQAIVLTVLLSLSIPRTSAQISSVTPIPKNPVTRGTVLLSTQVTATVRSFSWFRGTGADAANQILSYIPGLPDPQESYPPYIGRVTGFPNGSMELKNLMTSDSNNYTLQIQFTNPTTVQLVTVELKVYEQVTEPTVEYISSQLVENRGPAVISCVTSSAAVTIRWFFNNSPVLPDNIRLSLSADNRTLTIANVSRSDAGIYKCEAINPVSSSMSKPQTLTVAYGPDSKIDPSGPQTLLVGSTLSLSCIAESVPVPTYEWFINSTNLKKTESKLTIDKVSIADSGSYSCVARNNVTGLSATASVDITVSVTLPPEPLPGWAIAVIVVVVLAVCAVTAFLVYWFKFRKPAAGTSNSVPMDTTKQKPEPSTNAKPNGTADDVQYSSVSFVPKAAAPAKPATNENTVYSEVRR